MDLDLSDDQQLLRDTTARFVDREPPLTRVRNLLDDARGVDPAWLAAGAELGWFAMFVPEEHGGGSVSGNPVADAAVIAEVLGAAVQPGPFLPMNVVADALARVGSQEQQATVLPGLAAGAHVVSWAFADPAGAWDGSGVHAVATRDGFSLTGTAGFVQDAGLASWLLVTGRSDRGPVQFLVEVPSPGLTVEPLVCFDLARRLGTVTFDGVSLPASAQVGDADGTPAQIERQLDIALALQVAESVGALGTMFDFTLQYAKDRVAFGRPIGSFQALKHLLADDALYLETCRAGAVAVARAVGTERDDAPEVASMVKAYVGDQSVALAQDCLQVHGGIGYTWEHDLHLFMRRLSTNQAMYGSPGWHRERVYSMHEPSGNTTSNRGAR